MKHYVACAAIISTMLLSTAAMAEDFTIKLTGPELDVIGKGLGTQPFNDAAPLLQKLREQVVAQQPKPQEPAKVEEKK